MNHLACFRKLKNTYFVMRHGESLANVQGIVLSDPASAISGFGLSENGKNQVKESVLKQKSIGKGTIICSSDFKRARETAGIARKILKASPIHLSSKLRERFFGRWEGTSDKNYIKAWAYDDDPSANNGGVESINHLVNRVTLLIAQLEKRYSGKTILLVTHGDPMKMLRLSFRMKNP
jgi:broad specificity phosphatase PhoE